MDTLPGLEHGTVNNSVNFICPIILNHTQGIISYWTQVNDKLKRKKGIAFEYLEGYLEEKIWRVRNGCTSAEAFSNIIGDLAL